MLKSSEMEGVCMSYVQNAAAKAGPNYMAETRNYDDRSGAALVPANAEGHFDNLRNNTLLKVIGG